MVGHAPAHPREADHRRCFVVVDLWDGHRPSVEVRTGMREKDSVRIVAIGAFTFPTGVAPPAPPSPRKP